MWYLVTKSFFFPLIKLLDHSSLESGEMEKEGGKEFLSSTHFSQRFPTFLLNFGKTSQFSAAEIFPSLPLLLALMQSIERDSRSKGERKGV